MYRSLTEQMQSFSLAIQQAMIRNVQSTLVKQLEIFQAMQKPFVSQGLKLGSSMQHIMLEQIRMLNTGLQTPMAEQLNEFSSSVQRIMERASIKFTNGAASSFELTQERANHLTAQQQYVQRLVQLLTARADLRRALDLY